MSTRGCYGFYKNEENKLTYNHCDSYPNGLGMDIVDFIKETSIEDMNEIFNKIIMVKENSTPTQKQINECINFYDNDVGNQNINDWYCLLRKTQGNLNPYKNYLKYMIDTKEFMGNSLFCEWAYVINLTDNIFEIYTGFQELLQENRYKKYISKDRYNFYNVKLIKTYPLNNIPEGAMEEIENIFEED